MAPGEEDLTPDLVDDVAAPDFGADPAAMADPAVAPEAQVELVEHDLVDLVAKAGERDEYLDLAQRTQADFENFRKRSTKEMRAAEGRGVAKLARELLPAIDNLTLALAAIVEAGGDPGVLNGLKLVHDELLAALARVGIEPFSPQGELFDPVQHEAMAQQVVEGAPAGTVVEVYQRGYRIGEMVLRPARVVVAA